MSAIDEKTAGDYVRSEIPKVPKGATMREAEQALAEIHGRTLLVTDGKGPIGILTESDMMRCRVLGNIEVPVTKWMSQPLHGVSAHTPLAEAAQKMLDRGIRQLVVWEGEDLAGLIGADDLIAAAIDAKLQAPIEDLCTRPVETLESDQAVVSALGLMRELGVRAVVVTEDEEPIGVVEQRHIVEAAEEALLSPLKPFVRAGLIKLPGETPLCEALEKAHAEERRYIFCLADEDTRRGILTPSNVTAAVAGTTSES